MSAKILISLTIFIHRSHTLFDGKKYGKLDRQALAMYFFNKMGQIIQQNWDWRKFNRAMHGRNFNGAMHN